MNDDPLLAIDDLQVRYAAGPAVIAALSLTLARGEIGGVVGSSGCGKTTLLRAIAGFVPVAAGSIRVDGQRVAAAGASIAPEQRGVGLVFQDYALFPHLNVADNVGFGLRRRGRSARQRRVAEMLDLVSLAALARRYPHELSGGQQQRVALARALAPAPRLLLLDEPFSSLDVELRARLGAELRRILTASGTPAILVTHDQHEAFAIADRIGVMHAGRLEQWARPFDLYHAPATRYVADFIGEGAFLPARVLDARRAATALGEIDYRLPPQHAPAGADIEVLLRPDDVIHDDRSPLTARLLRKAFRGSDYVYTLQLDGGGELLARVPSRHDHRPGERIGIRLDAAQALAFAPAPRPAAQTLSL